MSFVPLELDVLVARQPFAPDNVIKAAALGVTRLINNRPDGEEHGQASGAEIEAAARAAGLDYRHIPVAGGVSAAEVAAMVEALDGVGKALIFCRSGTRSTYLWALARGSQGAKGDELAAKAAAAGYDLSPILAHLPR
jgi:uncharacterized protein (TIGR01244 family)